MKLLLVNYEYPPVGGGAAVATRSLAAALSEAGHEVTVLTAMTGNQAAVQVEQGVTIHRVKGFRRGIHDSGMFGALTFVLAAALRLPGLVRGAHFDCALFYFVVPTGLLAPIWHVCTRQPYIVALRGSDVPGYAEESSLAFLHILVKPLTRRILRRASHVVANSDGLRELALQAFATQQVHVIPNGVESSSFVPTRDRRGEQQAVRALCVARLIRRKGLDLLIAALSDPVCNDVELDIVGSGPRFDELVASCRARGLESRVNFLGHIDNSRLPGVYRRADVFVLPSRSESCSMAILEAMACGLPIIATRTGGMPELVQDGLNGFLVPVDDVQALACCLGRVARSAELRARMGRASRDAVDDHHHWGRVANGYLRLFGEASG